MLRRGGTCVLNGLPPGDFPVSIFDVVLKRLTIRGSIVGTRKDMQEALQFAADGKVKAIIETQPLEEINSVFDRLRRGEVQGRVVVKMAERKSALSGWCDQPHFSSSPQLSHSSSLLGTAGVSPCGEAQRGQRVGG